MRKAMWSGICALAWVLGTGVASADVVTVTLTGTVSRVNDPSSNVQVGAPATATYSYDTFAPSSSPGVYTLAAPPASISVTVAGQTYQSQSNWVYLLNVDPSTSESNESSLWYYAFDPANNQNALQIGISNNLGGWPASTAIPATAPPMGLGSSGSINVMPGSAGFSIQITSATLAPSLTISPASSSFVAQQNFDAVVLLSSQIGVTSMQASVGGTPIALSYPGTCQLTAPNSAGRTGLICPNASAVLAALGAGATQVDWQVVLADGSTVQQSIIWNLVL